MEDSDKNKQYPAIKMTRDGTDSWQQVTMKLQARAMMQKKTQIFAVRVADLPEHYPVKNEFGTEELYDREMKRWTAGET